MKLPIINLNYKKYTYHGIAIMSRLATRVGLAVNTRLKHAGLSRDVSFKQILVGSETYSKYSFGISCLSFSIQKKNASNKLT